MLEQVEGSRVGVPWGKCRERLRNDYALAIGILSQLGKSKADGLNLIEDALLKISGKVKIEQRQVMEGRFTEYLERRIPSASHSSASQPEHNETVPVGTQHKSRKILTFSRFLNTLNFTRAAVALVLLVLTLLGITLADVVPLPCDLWPFSITARCVMGLADE